LSIAAWLEWVRESSLNREIYGNSVQQWLIAAAAIVLAFIALPVMNRVLRSRAERYSLHPAGRWLAGLAAMLKETRFWFLLTVSLWAGTLMLIFPDPDVPLRIRTLTIVVLLLQIAIWGSTLLQYLIDRHIHSRLAEHPEEVTTMSALAFLAKLTLYTVVLLLILDNLNINVTALLAGLGVGGVAVALAAQNILGDLFSSMSIVLDKPFVLGDFIVVDDLMGTIEHIGLKTTRVRSLSGEQLIFSNSDLLKSRIRNFKRMQQRRVVFTIRVVYETPAARLEEIPEMIREAVEECQKTRFDRAHFAAFGDSSLNFEAVYYVLSADYNIYMDIQQQINLKLLRGFNAKGVKFSFPMTLPLMQAAEPVKLRMEKADEPSQPVPAERENPAATGGTT
jgi:small-conductance mechanosensitive channel